MLAYIARRVLLMVPTLLGIMLISFAIVQFAPGGPVERILAQLQGIDAGAASRVTGGGGDFAGGGQQQPGGGGGDPATSRYRGAQGTRPGLHQAARDAVRLPTSRPMSASPR
jgi:microcin C transport system permease protein